MSSVRKAARIESRTKAAFEMVVVDWLGEITDHPLHQGAVPSLLVRVSGNENRRDHVAGLDEVPMKLNTAHAGHLHVADQTRRRAEERRYQEIGRRGERFDSVA